MFLLETDNVHIEFEIFTVDASHNPKFSPIKIARYAHCSKETLLDLSGFLIKREPLN